MATMKGRARHLLGRLAGGRELGWLLLLVGITVGIWAFAGIADEVMEGNTHAVDRAVLLALRTPGDPADPLGPGWLEEVFRDVTALGGNVVLTLVTLGVAGFLALARRRREAGLIVAAVATGLALSFLLKSGFDRPRPDLVSHGTVVYTHSFPSGHSMLSAVTYLTLGALLARQQTRRRLKAYVLGMAVLLTGLVGLSRIYLGVHWPTDVLAGWAAGASWALLCWLVARAVGGRGGRGHGVAGVSTPEGDP